MQREDNQKEQQEQIDSWLQDMGWLGFSAHIAQHMLRLC